MTIPRQPHVRSRPVDTTCREVPARIALSNTDRRLHPAGPERCHAVQDRRAPSAPRQCQVFAAPSPRMMSPIVFDLSSPAAKSLRSDQPATFHILRDSLPPRRRRGERPTGQHFQIARCLLPAPAASTARLDDHARHDSDDLPTLTTTVAERIADREGAGGGRQCDAEWRKDGRR
jgi:hypothetical protein